MNWIPDSTNEQKLIRKPIPLWLCKFCGYKVNSFQKPEKCPACGRSLFIKRIGGRNHQPEAPK